MKVYLVIKIKECGFSEEYIPFKVFEDKQTALKVARDEYGFVKEIEYVPISK